MFLCKNGTDTNIYNNKSDDEDNDDDDEKKEHTKEVCPYILPSHVQWSRLRAPSTLFQWGKWKNA